MKLQKTDGIIANVKKMFSFLEYTMYRNIKFAISNMVFNAPCAEHFVLSSLKGNYTCILTTSPPVGDRLGLCAAGDCKMFIGPSNLQITNFYKPELDFTGQDLRTCG